MHVLLEVDGEEHDLYLVREGEVVKIEVGGETFEAKVSDTGVVTVGANQHHIVLGDKVVSVDGHEIPFRVLDFQSAGAPGAHGGARKAAKIKPPMPGKIVSLDPWGHRVAQDFSDLIAEGIDIRPTIAITKARLTLGEIYAAVATGRLEVDGEIVHEAAPPAWVLRRRA